MLRALRFEPDCGFSSMLSASLTFGPVSCTGLECIGLLCNPVRSSLALPACYVYSPSEGIHRKASLDLPLVSWEYRNGIENENYYNGLYEDCY